MAPPCTTGPLTGRPARGGEHRLRQHKLPALAQGLEPGWGRLAYSRWIAALAGIEMCQVGRAFVADAAGAGSEAGAARGSNVKRGASSREGG